MKHRQSGPTITVTVVALATAGHKARSKAIIAFTAAMRSEKVLIALII